MRAADALVRSLEAHGVNRVYCVPGESYLTLLDAFHGSNIEVIVCRHEGGAGFMAVAEAKLTGKPTVCAVSRGPGATNVSIAVHVAEQDAVPVVFLVGQVSREERGRGAFQEVDYSQFFGSMAKGVWEPADGTKLLEVMPRALRLAAEGQPGPVVVSLLEDMLSDDVAEAAAVVFPVAKPHHAAEDLARIQGMVDRAERPLIIAGAALRGAAGAQALKRFAEAQRIPVAVTWKNQDVFDNTSPLYAGHLGFGNPLAHRKILAEADLIIAVGTRLGDIGSLNYTLPRAGEPDQPVIHIYGDGAAIGKVSRTELGLVADPVPVLQALAQDARVVSSAREGWISKLSAFIADFRTFKTVNPGDGVDFGTVVVALAKHAPADTIITTDAGNMSSWVHRHWAMTPANTLLGAIAGAMGFGVPSVVAASLVQPSRTAICFVGDGGVLMTGQEMATAMQYGATPKIVLSDNGIYGTIRTHQEREFPGRVSGTMLTNPEFSVWGESFGFKVFRLERGGDVEAVVKTFIAEKGPALLHVRSSRQALSAFGQLKTA